MKKTFIPICNQHHKTELLLSPWNNRLVWKHLIQCMIQYVVIYIYIWKLDKSIRHNFSVTLSFTLTQSSERFNLSLKPKSYVLLICPTFRYSTLCEHIKHYTTRIDYNQDLYIYIYIYVALTSSPSLSGWGGKLEQAVPH